MACKSRLDSERSGDTCLSQETTSTSLSGETSHVTENETECSDVSPSEAPLSSKPRFDLGENSFCSNLESIATDCADEQSKIKQRKEMGNDNKSTFPYLYEMKSCPKTEEYKNGYNCRQNNRRSFALKRRSVPYDYEEMIKQYNAPANRDDFKTRRFSPNSREQRTEYADHYFRKSKTQINRRSLSESCAEDEPFLRPDDKTKNRTENFERNLTIYHASAYKGSAGNKSESNSNYESIRGIPNTYSDTSSAVYAAKGAGYAELNTRLDGLVHDFQEQGVQYRVLRKSYVKLKKLFLALAVVNIILIMCNMSVMPMITFLKGGIPGTPGTPDPLPYNETRVLETVLCVSCSSLKLHIREENWIMVSSSRDRCCFNKPVDLISTILKEIKKRLENQKRELRKYCKCSNVTAVGSPNENIGNDDLIAMLSDSMKSRRSIIHLEYQKGDLHKENTWTYLTWASKMELGHLSLRSDKKAIIVRSDGIYYLYGRVRFQRNAASDNNRNISLTFSVFNLKTERRLETVRQRCMFRNGTLEHESYIQTILELKQDDEISIYFPESQLSFLSRDYQAHALGMFDLT